MTSAWKRLINNEISIDEALQLLVNNEGEIQWSKFDLEVSQRFQSSLKKNLNDLSSIVPLLLWQQCYYIGCSIDIAPQSIQRYKDITGCDIKHIYISEESSKRWSAVKEYDINAININKFNDLFTEEEKSDDISLTSQKYFRKFPDPKDRLAFLISFALHHNASDVHLEAERNHLNIRFRIDGLLRNLSRLPIKDGKSLINALKVMCSMDITDRRRPHDGSTQTSYSFENDPVPVDLRVSTYPCVCGEKAVIRLLPQRNRFETLADLGFTERALSIYRKWINEPHGIIIITGPTGSGKTSTLYASLKEVSSEEKNTVTIEDPVEYTMPGITQGGVNPLAGMTFETGLKSILRQDPDIIMVGEIRDNDTADTAIRAALTGHLVFTTVHTNDVVSVIPRLKGLGLDPDLISDSLLGIVAQRLVRKNCKRCEEHYDPQDKDLEFLNLKIEDCNPAGWRKGSGCEECFNSGFSGREAVVEILDIDETVKQYIRKDEISNIYSYLQEIECNSFRYSACEKVINGVTTIGEIRRVLSSHAMRSFESK